MARQGMSTTGADPVPGWVYLADCPPTDDEPWTLALDELERDRGVWLGAVLLAAAFIAGIVVGMLVLR